MGLLEGCRYQKKLITPNADISESALLLYLQHIQLRYKLESLNESHCTSNQGCSRLFTKSGRGLSLWINV